MEKITCVLAVVERPSGGGIVLDKAESVARCFGARVEVLDSGPHGATPIHEVILRRVLETHADLVVKAPAGAHPLHRFALTGNDWELAQECPVPVLLARQRPWANPARFAAAVDVSDRDTADVTRAILHTAGFLAMGLRGNLDILYSEREQHDESVRMERAVKLAQLVREYHVGSERIQVFTGEPESVLPPLAAARKYDVLVLGAQTRQEGFHSIFGGTTGRMIEATEGDVVLVKAPASGSSSREQRSDELEQFV